MMEKSRDSQAGEIIQHQQEELNNIKDAASLDPGVRVCRENTQHTKYNFQAIITGIPNDL